MAAAIQGFPRLIHSDQEPLEARVFYNYQPRQINANQLQGSLHRTCAL